MARKKRSNYTYEVIMPLRCHSIVGQIWCDFDRVDNSGAIANSINYFMLTYVKSIEANEIQLSGLATIIMDEYDHLNAVELGMPNKLSVKVIRN